MKKIILLACILFTVVVTNAQELPDFDSIPLAKPEDFNERADQAALTSANYLLSTPLDKESSPRIEATQYILKWMEGTPNYTFTIDEQITKINKKGIDLLGLYLAATTKYCLENKANSKDAKLVKLNTYKLMAEYCTKPENNVKVSGELKKLIEAYQADKLEEYLKL